jgi:hypothetical protein
MNSRTLRPVICLLALSLSPACFAQTIRIRVINSKTQVPLQKQSVSIALAYEKDEVRPASYDPNVKLETDVNGEAQLRLPDPAPRHILVHLQLNSQYWHCGCLAAVSTTELVQRGHVESASHQPVGWVAGVKSEPGELRFMVRPFTLLDRLFYPLMKD